MTLPGKGLTLDGLAWEVAAAESLEPDNPLFTDIVSRRSIVECVGLFERRSLGQPRGTVRTRLA